MRFLFVDRILNQEAGRWIHGIKHVTAEDFYLTQDESGKPCFMPSLIGETLGQLAAWNAMASNQFTARPVAGVTSKATLHRPAYVGETLFLESVIDDLDEKAVQYHSSATIRGETIFTLEGALGPMLLMADFIDEEEVRAQYDEINHPGDFAELLDKVTIEQAIAPQTRSFQFDAVLAHEPGKALTAVKHVSRAAPYFPDHFPRKPVLPLTVLLECKLNLARYFVSGAPFDGSYSVHELSKIKMNSFVRPGDTVTTHVKVKTFDEEQLVLTFRSEVQGERVCVLTMVLKKRA